MLSAHAARLFLMATPPRCERRPVMGLSESAAASESGSGTPQAEPLPSTHCHLLPDCESRASLFADVTLCRSNI